MAAADLFVMPSVRDRAGNIDGLPNVILEAMALARPVVATRVAGIPLAVIHGHNGLLVPEKDPEALARALVEALSQPERLHAWGQASRALIEERLNWPVLAARYEQVFGQLPGLREPGQSECVTSSSTPWTKTHCSLRSCAGCACWMAFSSAGTR